MKRLIGIFGFFLAAGCSLVDEDFSECPDALVIDYEMQLVTNVQTEISTVLKLDVDIPVADALRKYLQGIFSDHAHDVDLSFYDVEAPMAVLEQITDIVDDNQASYTLRIPVRDYMHLAVANITDNPQVRLEGKDRCRSSRLLQRAGVGDPKVVPPHTTGIFTARLPMEMHENTDQTFSVNLHMANCATALVIDNTSDETPEITDIRAFTSGFASSFNIAENSYTFDENPLIKADLIPVEGNQESLFATVQFPSMDPDTKSIIETTDPFVAKNVKDVLWEWVVYVTLSDGSVTESRLGIIHPLRAGQFKMIRARIARDGRLSTDDTSVGVSVTLDWNEGGSHVIPL